MPSDIKWVKLSTSTPDDEKIKIIDTMPDSDALWVIWVKLIIQAGKCNAGGYVWLDRDTPYTEETLATVFNRPLNTIRLARKVLVDLKMIDWPDGGHIFIFNFWKHQSIDELDMRRLKDRERQQRWYKRHKQLQLPDPNVRLTLPNAHEDDMNMNRDENDGDKNYVKKNEDAEKLWGTVLGKLSDKVNKSNFKTWLAGTKGVDYQDNIFVVGCPNSFIAEYIQKNQMSLVEKELCSAAGRELAVEFVVI